MSQLSIAHDETKNELLDAVAGLKTPVRNPYVFQHRCILPVIVITKPKCAKQKRFESSMLSIASYITAVIYLQRIIQQQQRQGRNKHCETTE